MPSPAPRKLPTPMPPGALSQRYAVVFSFSGFKIIPKEDPVNVTPYLFFPGSCEAAFKFYEKALGASIEMMMPHAGSPAEAHVPPEWANKVMHARLKLGDRLLMGSDAPPGHYRQMQGFSVTLDVDTPAEAERVFKALSENGAVTMPIEKTFWAERFGMVTDQFGTPWMVNCEKPA